VGNAPALSKPIVTSKAVSMEATAEHHRAKGVIGVRWASADPPTVTTERLEMAG